ncbi:MAG: nitroreductase family deazaflavin-dependent oxidoreductase [Actinomycetota bacterium]|nr:nitroreductase family deazaflavin-dependent oxidoreductase [Actinomycetota bacterium]
MNPELRHKVKDVLFLAATFVHKELYRRSGGRIAGKVGKVQMLMLTTTGRKTGQPRTTPLNYGVDGDRLVLVASFGGDDRHPQWYRNLQANPDVTVQIGTETRRMRAATAAPEEKPRLWSLMTERYAGYDSYQRKTERDIPVVVLSPL